MKYNKRAFTLIELLVVVLVIGILAAVALPQYRVAVKKANLARYMALVSALAQSEERYYLENGEYTDTLDDLDISLPISEDCERVHSDGRDQITCGSSVFSITDEKSSVQAGDETIRYVKFIQDYEMQGHEFKKGKTYCWADLGNSTAISVCKSFGGTELEIRNGWHRFVLP